MRKIIIAPDSFKGTMTSVQVCDIIASSIKKICPETEVVKLPIADGGEGTVDAYLHSCGGERHYLRVKDPLLRDVEAYYGILEDEKTAVIEMAQASGLPLVGENKNALKATSYGTGQLIKDALDNGCNKIILGIGGSATNDGGCGAFAALGVGFLDFQGKKIEPNGAGIAGINNIDISGIDNRIRDVKIFIACDVNNVLYGKDGASYVFGPQKGASKDEAEILDKNLKHYSKVFTRQFGVDHSNIPGTGAAGGIALPFLYLTKARMVSGIDAILETVKFDDVIKGANLVLTGEGRIDGQSLKGKLPLGVALHCKKQNIPVVVIVGSIGYDIDLIYEHGISAIFSTVNDTVPFSKARATCKEDLAFLVESLMRFATII